ncbi:flagellar hook-basal body complex protein FliE [Novosphingobium sp. M1R2S20]|uniref:Flagellar hook-basal body complex protein FliE n=1 Tax=Novosphingobium rhizovicinum TaxID=3228928 RepID=A0ABV3RAG4_9SPHN
MSIGALDAAAAYGRALGTGSSAGIAKPSTMPGAGVSSGGGSFGSMIEEMVTDAAQSMRGAEQASARQVAGQGDLIDVVTAIGAAETALDTVVAVRDRVVSAYGEIMRMQI